MTLGFRFLTLFLMVTQLSFAAFAKDSFDARPFRRLSYILRGKPLIASEVESVRDSMSRSSSEEQVLQEYADLWMQGKDFSKIMKQRVDALFQLKWNIHNNDQPIDSAFDRIVLDVVQNNKTWDQLLLQQNYEATNQAAADNQIESDYNFFQFVFYDELQEPLANHVEQRAMQLGSSVKTEEYVSLRASTSQQKQVLSGVITTQRFFGRYQTTKINKNRRRAAQIFRIFLCDNMKPVVLSTAKEDQELLHKSLQIKTAHNGTIDLPSEQRHASDKQCQSCHYKLDPMADLFAGSSVFLNPFSPQGGLVFKRANGQKVDIPVQGLYEMSENLVQQEEYLQCQSQHFWNWIIGEDVPLDQATKSELSYQFDQLERKPKDFIRYLVGRIEFTKPNSLRVDDVRYSHIKPILKRCDSCHAEDVLAPDLSSGYPFPSFIGSNQDILASLVKQTALNHGGRGAKMPPVKAGWTLTARERDLIYAWLKGGAKDNQGIATIDDPAHIGLDDSRDFEGKFESQFQPTFYNTHRRLVSADELPNTLEILFGSTLSYDCKTNYFEFNGHNMGYPVVATGLPLFKYVNPNYLRWWVKCLSSFSSNLVSWAGSAPPMNTEAMHPLVRNQLGEVRMWSDLFMEDRKQLLLEVFDVVIKPGVMTNRRKKIALNKALRKINGKSDLRVTEAIAKAAMVFMMSEEFLTY
jgi:hypothetical protein